MQTTDILKSINEDVLKKIVADRIEDTKRYGHAQGLTLPAERSLPLVRFGREPFIITEIKRRSPSRGNIGEDVNILAHAEQYVKKGSRNISVLTEQNHFNGSLSDLISIKSAFPDVAVLRKDFLLDEEDIDISYRAGADVVLLIAGILDDVRLEKLYKKTKALGLAALVEVHSQDELKRVSYLEPEFIGINSRDLTSFKVDILNPVKLRQHINWDAKVVFESGLWEFFHGFLAGSCGASGILVGEALMREPERFDRLSLGLSAGKKAKAEGACFWKFLTGRMDRHRPLVKICGLTREEDVALADRLGADLLGFVLADSPRKVDINFLRSLDKTHAKKVGVIVDGKGSSISDAVKLVKEGVLDAIQFHGDEPADTLFSLDIPWYKAVRAGDASDIDKVLLYNSPRILVDAKSSRGYGGTGERVCKDVVEYASGKMPLWLAGGLGPDSIADVVKKYNPELVDVSSGVEESPGKKDINKLKKFFEELSNAAL